MKIKVSVVYLVLFVLGVIAAGVITGVYGNDVGIWISYGFIAAYGIMIMINAVMTEKIASVNVETYDSKEEITPEKIKELPKELGQGEEKKTGESTLETIDVPPEPPKEEPKKVQLSEEQLKTVNKIVLYIKGNLEKGHTLEKIRVILEKAYTPELIDFVLKNALKVEEPELPDMGEPEVEVTPETLNAEIEENKEQHEATQDLKNPKTKEERLKKGFKCEKCGKVCKNKGSLKNHMRLSKKCQS